MALAVPSTVSLIAASTPIPTGAPIAGVPTAPIAVSSGIAAAIPVPSGIPAAIPVSSGISAAIPVSSVLSSAGTAPPAVTGKVPITVEVPWEGELPNSTTLVCRSNEDLFTHLCCSDAGGIVQARPYDPSDETSGSASDPADAASSAPSASGEVAKRDATALVNVPPAGMLVALCALPAENGSAFDACTQMKAASWRTNATTMCYDPSHKEESRGVRMGVGMTMLGALAMSVLAVV